MEEKGKYLLYIFNIFLIGMIVLNIFSYDIQKEEVNYFALDLREGKYISYLEIDNIKEDLLENITVEENIIEDIKESVKDNVVLEKEVEDIPNVEIIPEDVKVEEKVEINEEKEQEIVLETLIGNLVGYGPDCYGCTSFKTASGKYIGEGNIYFEDATYGKVRIVAGDYSYPFGTIVKISNVDFYNDEPFYAVVLDRGGNIGKDKKFLFDLLFASEKDAYALGKEINIKFEIMRLGY